VIKKGRREVKIVGPEITNVTCLEITDVTIMLLSTC